MRIAVMGAGGVGGYFGGLLTRAGQEVTFIARGAHLEAIRREGLRVASDLSGEFAVRSDAAHAQEVAGFWRSSRRPVGTSSSPKTSWTPIYMTGSAGVNAATQVTFGEMRSVAETRELLRDAYREGVEVAKAQRAPIGEDVAEWCMTALDDFPEEGMTSLANDFRNGNRVELEGLTGAVVRMARGSGVATPVNNAIYALLKPAALRIEAARTKDS